MGAIINLQEIQNSAAARLLEPYYLDLCEQSRELIAEIFRLKSTLSDSEFETYHIRLNVLDLKKEEVVKMMMQLKKHSEVTG